MVDFIVEDGTGLVDATSYVSVEELQQYVDNFYGTDLTGYTDEDLERFLNRGTVYIDNTYGSNYNGILLNDSQALGWPRKYAWYVPTGIAIDDDVIPIEVKNATCESVLSLISGSDPYPIIPATGVISEQSVKVDVIEKTTKYEPSTMNPTGQPLYPIIDDIMRRLLGNVGMGAYGELVIQRI